MLCLCDDADVRLVVMTDVVNDFHAITDVELSHMRPNPSDCISKSMQDLFRFGQLASNATWDLCCGAAEQFGPRCPAGDLERGRDGRIGDREFDDALIHVNPYCPSNCFFI
jgi:hypothetical protein